MGFKVNCEADGSSRILKERFEYLQEAPMEPSLPEYFVLYKQRASPGLFFLLRLFYLILR